MPIAYYARHPEAKHWDEIWKVHEPTHLLAVAQRDPLSDHLLKHLPAQGLILEGGCGLGQYIVYLRDRGYNVIGGDLSPTALRIHRQAYPNSPLLSLDLRRMLFPDDAFQGHISLGVVEHLEEGPLEMLHEFYRTLAPGGVLLISVPWVNGYRRLTMPLIRRKQTRLRAAGADFYQYAFTRSEVRAFLEGVGFQVLAFHSYSPAKGLREFPLLRRLYYRTAHCPVERSAPLPIGAAARVGKVHAVRRFLYWSPVLWAFSHMILAVAQKPES